MGKTQTTLAIIFAALLIALSFQLGWSMRGDKIYGDMFRGTVVAMEQLPAMKGMK